MLGAAIERVMAISNRTEKRILFMLFPNASPTVDAIGGKVLRILSEAAASVVFVGSEIPSSATNFDNVKCVDMKVRLHRVDSRSPRIYSALVWMIKFFYIQFRMGVEVIRQRNDTDIVLCFLGSHYQFPVFIARLLGKQIICSAAGVDTASAESNYGSAIVRIVQRMMRYTFDRADAVVIEGWELSRNPGLSGWTGKMVNGALYFGDAERFRRKTRVEDRIPSIGFIGRLSAEKGILEFVGALPQILDELPDVEVFIAGTGGLDEEVRERVNGFDVEGKVRILNWVNYEDLPDLYNKLKLIVIPSYTEGLPNTMLEAMSCGTPVLATAVGGIPGVIEEGVTGFLLPGNSSIEIGEKVVEVLTKDDLLQTAAENAWELVHENYSLQASVERYRKIFLNNSEDYE